MCRFVLALLALGCLGAAAPESSPQLDSAERARAFHRRAAEEFTRPNAAEDAVLDVRRAIELEPSNPEHWMLFGMIRVREERRAASRQCFRRAIVLDPRDPTPYIELAAAWKREWSFTLDTLALRFAMGLLDTAAALRRSDSEAWLRLVPLRFEGHDYGGATRASAHALAADPERPEALLAAAYTAFHDAEIERADSLFHAAIPRLDQPLARLFTHPETMLGVAAPEHGWEALDPDPTTPQNELELEYWSRLAQAILLFQDPERSWMDARFQTYVQYGPPTAAAVNPNGVPLYFRTFATPEYPEEDRYASRGGNRGKPPTDFPTPIQVWVYPELGMSLRFQDISLHGRFQPQSGRDFDPGSRPDPGLLVANADFVSIGAGDAVFHRFPPLGRRVPLRSLIAHFGGDRPRIVAQAQAEISGDDSLEARWAVEDGAHDIVLRGESEWTSDACDPEGQRMTQFGTELPPGDYRISVSARDGHGRRGLVQSPLSIPSPARGLMLSDLVLTCGDPSLMIGGSSARFDANIDARVPRSRALGGYLEIYGLAAGRDSLSYFEYDCEVRRAAAARKNRSARDDRAILISTSRKESQVGPLRRQFVIVPLQSLPAGAYELSVRVIDLTSGAEESRTVAFVRE